jgi:hypothetical protein
VGLQLKRYSLSDYNTIHSPGTPTGKTKHKKKKKKKKEKGKINSSNP